MADPSTSAAPSRDEVMRTAVTRLREIVQQEGFQADPSGPDANSASKTGFRERTIPRWQIVVAILLLPLIPLFFVWCIVDQFLPSHRQLEDGWVRLVDRTLGFEIDVPTWPNKSRNGDPYGYQFHYSLRPDVYATMAIRSEKWTLSANQHKSPALAMKEMVASRVKLQGQEMTILSNGADQPKTPVLEYVVHSNMQSGAGQIYVLRSKVFLQRGRLIFIELGYWASSSSQSSPHADRLFDSLRIIQ